MQVPYVTRPCYLPLMQAESVEGLPFIHYHLKKRIIWVSFESLTKATQCRSYHEYLTLAERWN